MTGAAIDTLTHSWRASSYFCFQQCACQFTGCLPAKWQRQVGVNVSEEQTDYTFRVSRTHCYGLDSRRFVVRLPETATNFSFLQNVRTRHGVYPASYSKLQEVLSSGVQRIQGVQRPSREADYSLPTNADVKNSWRYASTPHVLMGSAGKPLPFTVRITKTSRASCVQKHTVLLRLTTLIPLIRKRLMTG